jgi:glutamate carboxypeptidase
VSRLEALSRAEEGLLVTVGVFRGGVARQVVPGRAELHVDLRAPDSAQARVLLQGVRSVVDSVAIPGVRVELRGAVTRPAFPRPASELLWELAVARAHELGLRLHPVCSRGGSDASFAAALGVPTLDGLGPICHDSCARGERIEIGSLAERAALMASLIVDLAGRWRGPRGRAQA